MKHSVHTAQRHIQELFKLLHNLIKIIQQTRDFIYIYTQIYKMNQ